MPSLFLRSSFAPPLIRALATSNRSKVIAVISGVIWSSPRWFKSVPPAMCASTALRLPLVHASNISMSALAGALASGLLPPVSGLAGASSFLPQPIRAMVPIATMSICFMFKFYF